MKQTAAVEADVLRIGFDVGCYTKDDIARWADRHIAAVDEPSLELITLSMNKRVDPHELLKLLGSIGQSDDQQKVATEIGFIGLLYSSQRITTEKTIQSLWSLKDVSGITCDQQSDIYCLEDGYKLALDGIYGEIADVELELREFLSTHVDDLTLNHSQLFSDLEY